MDCVPVRFPPARVASAAAVGQGCGRQDQSELGGRIVSRPRQRVCLETGQRLDINQLRRTSIMPRELEGEKAGSIWVRYPDGFEQEIQFVSRRRHFGGRQYYFQCPAMGRLASVLWRPPGATRLACRQAWGGQVGYRSQFAEPTSRAHLAQAKIQQRLCCPEWWDDMPPRPSGCGRLPMRSGKPATNGRKKSR